MTPGPVDTLSNRLERAIAASGSLLCLGLDPNGLADAAAAERFCFDALEGTLDAICAVKPNLAYFEQFGADGRRLLDGIRARVPSDRLLIIDGKRGDIGTSADAYARALFDGLGADAVTVNPLMGEDAVRPFIDRPGRGAFLLARTSNAGARDLLELRLESGEAVYEHIIALGLGWDPGAAVGFVVGATDPEAVRRVRKLAPAAPLLVPGVGAQGGALEESVVAGMSAGGGAMVIAVSRGITGAPEGARVAAARLCERISTARQAHTPGATVR